jgi:hypothetical protein
MTGKVSVSPSVAQILIRDRHLFALMMFLRTRNTLDGDFAISDALATSFNWPLRQLRGARCRAIDAGWLVMRSAPKRSHPARYAFGSRCWCDLPDALVDVLGDESKTAHAMLLSTIVDKTVPQQNCGERS